MMAATATCAITATAVLHQLALHAEWQDRVRAESLAEIGDGRLDLDALDRMQSLGMVINESMRLLAPVPAAIRKIFTEASIQANFVPKDTMSVVPGLNHYWPGLWTDPQAFDPERFSKACREDRLQPSCIRAVRCGCTQMHGMGYDGIADSDRWLPSARPPGRGFIQEGHDRYNVNLRFDLVWDSG